LIFVSLTSHAIDVEDHDCGEYARQCVEGGTMCGETYRDIPGEFKAKDIKKFCKDEGLSLTKGRIDNVNLNAYCDKKYCTKKKMDKSTDQCKEEKKKIRDDVKEEGGKDKKELLEEIEDIDCDESSKTGAYLALILSTVMLLL